MHEEGAGRPSTATTDDNIEGVREGIKKLVQRWKKCIEKQGDYVEKWCYCKFSIFIEIKFVSVLRIFIDSPSTITLWGVPSSGVWRRVTE